MADRPKFNITPFISKLEKDSTPAAFGEMLDSLLQQAVAYTDASLGIVPPVKTRKILENRTMTILANGEADIQPVTVNTIPNAVPPFTWSIDPLTQGAELFSINSNGTIVGRVIISKTESEDISSVFFDVIVIDGEGYQDFMAVEVVVSE